MGSALPSINFQMIESPYEGPLMYISEKLQYRIKSVLINIQTENPVNSPTHYQIFQGYLPEKKSEIKIFPSRTQGYNLNVPERELLEQRQ